MILVKQWGMKIHIFGVFNSLTFNIAHFIYILEDLANEKKENDHTITNIVSSIEDSSKFRIGFAAGTMWILGLAINANLQFANSNMIYFMLSF